MTLPVFVADAELLADVSAGATVTLTGPEGRHAVSVMRLRAGEGVDLVDGAGRRVRGEVSGVSGKDRLDVAVQRVIDESAPPVRLALVQALAKGGRDEQAVESAVELGADLVVPWQSARCVSRWDAKGAKGQEKWQATVLAATKQSRRARLAEVVPHRSTPELAAWVRGVVGDGGLILVLHEEAREPIRAALAGAAELLAGGQPGGDGQTDAGQVSAGQAAAGHPVVGIVVGPEGGITPEEVAALEVAGARTVRLGPHVLRTSTAGPVALAVIAERLGMWATPAS